MLDTCKLHSETLLFNNARFFGCYKKSIYLQKQTPLKMHRDNQTNKRTIKQTRSKMINSFVCKFIV